MSIKSNKLSIILVILVLIFSGLYLNTCTSESALKKDILIERQNSRAISDSLRTYMDDNKNLVYEKGILMASKGELKSLNKDLYNELNSLKKDPIVIIKPEIIIEHDTVEIRSNLIEYSNGTYGLEWVHDTVYSNTSSRLISGSTKFRLDSNLIIPLNTVIHKDQIKFNLVTGITENQDYFEIFVRSSYPGFSAINIEGSIIDKKRFIRNSENSWVIGPHIGYGLQFTKSGEISHGLNLGIGVTYNFNKRIKNLFRK